MEGSKSNNSRLAFLIAIFLTGYLYAQEVQKVAKNAIYIEGLGNGVIYSLNYERNVGNNLSIRVGVGYFGASGEATYKDTGKKEEIVANIGTFPIMANYFIGKGRHKIEIGGGMVLFTISAHGDEVSSNGIKFKAGLLPALTGTLGWRYQPREGGLVFKIAFTPIFNLGSFLPYGGISVGYSF